MRDGATRALAPLLKPPPLLCRARSFATADGSGGDRRGRHSKLALAALLLGLSVLASCWSERAAPPPIRIGLIAPLSGPSGASGEAIRRGMLLAIDDVSAGGGVLQRPLALVARDVQNDPSAGVAVLRELADRDGIVAVFGGIFSPVMLAQLDAVHELQIPLIDPWGSVTAITQNSRSPSFAFRVSVSDESADEFLARYTIEVVGARRPGIVAVTTSWGDSNVTGLTDSLALLGSSPVGVERFDEGETNMLRRLERLRAAGADSLLMVANAPEGAAVIRAKTSLGWSVPIVSHWGISGGHFVRRAGVENAEGVLTLQTYSFLGPQSAKGNMLLSSYHSHFGTRAADEIPAPVGVAHGYDGVQLLARAIQRAGTTDGPAVRDALEHLDPYDGVLKRYEPAFTPDRHDALEVSDYMMTVWQSGKLVPASRPRLSDR